MTASVSISITRPGGTSISANGQVADELVADIAAMLGALIFDGASAPAAATPAGPVPLAPSAPATSAGSLTAPAPVQVAAE